MLQDLPIFLCQGRPERFGAGPLPWQDSAGNLGDICRVDRSHGSLVPMLISQPEIGHDWLTVPNVGDDFIATPVIQRSVSVDSLEFEGDLTSPPSRQPVLKHAHEICRRGVSSPDQIARRWS